MITTDNSFKEIARIEIPDNTAGYVTIEIVAAETSGASMLVGRKAYPYLKKDGTITVVDVATDLIPDTGDLLAHLVSWTVSTDGTAIVVGVAGAEGIEIAWSCTYSRVGFSYLKQRSND